MTEAVTIILVEDDDGHALLIERNLRRSGVANQIRRFPDGLQALDFLLDASRTGGSYTVLLDIKLPGIDGTEVLRRLKKNERTATIPVIMLTTTDDPREIEHCYQVGCNVYVAKPVEYDRFVDAIMKLGLLLQVIRVSPIAAEVEGRNGGW